MPDNHITKLYKTPKGSVWETYDEAVMAHRLESDHGIFLDGYIFKAVVKAACTPAAEEEFPV